jgi:mono/diheme cytochrome c family protein
MRWLTWAPAAALLAFAACGSARRSEPITGPFEGDGSEMRGKLVYAEYCNKCHPGGEAGLGPSLNDKPLPVFLMKLQVRRGLGAMPSFNEHQISAEQLEDLMDCIVAYRHHK